MIDTLSLVIFLIVLSFIMELIDTSIGMMYGTLTGTILIGYGFEPLLVIPPILISQTVGSTGGTIMHQKLQNADFRGLTRDTKILLAMLVPGLVAVVIGMFAAVTLPSIGIKTYIGILVIVMSILCFFNFSYRFKWWKHYALGVLAAFNKALTGGGFGPVASTGGIINGLDSRESIAISTFSKVGIGLAAFVAYMIYYDNLNLFFIFSLSAGAFVGGLIGPHITSRVNHRLMRRCVGILGIVSGMWLMLRVIWPAFT